MPTNYRQTHQIDRRKLLKMSSALATLWLTDTAVAGYVPVQLPIVHSPLRREPVLRDMPSNIIKVIGVGGSGRNTVAHMIERSVLGVEFICVDSEAQAFNSSIAPSIVLLGDVRTAIDGAHLLFITADMNNGADAATASAVASIARNLGILTVGVVTRPMVLDGGRYVIPAESKLTGLQANVDSLIALQNDTLQNLRRNGLGKNSQDAAIAYANDLIKLTVSGMIEMINVPIHTNVDVEDLRRIMDQPGTGMMATALANGPDRARIAVEQVLAFPMNDGIDLSGARAVLVMISATKGSLKLFESKLAIESIRAQAAPQVRIIYGTNFDDALGDDIRITLVAAGVKG
jgi:cell division protein FtsZ